ncbi:hypothetical protein ATPR_0713 [Acetobacter tropicalis NBRC 101654]|uniref:Uncharacterized protein n=1 Tax=Acetobacter tropicalis NBRC 101654 TaxID=749388 RepID=F7VBG9_9PROT|nr:hypothetical protein ATPR_0713 [Acetobacter tropicalis NBRC 101654]
MKNYILFYSHFTEKPFSSGITPHQNIDLIKYNNDTIT